MPLKGTKKILLFSIFILFFLFVNNSYASTYQDSWILWNLLFSIFDLISSIWYLLPIIAWKLLTNDLLYWVSIWLDSLLWDIWNFSRSIANFLIGFLFIYFIFKFITTSNDASLIKTNLPKIAFWSIIINSSWFIIAVLIDISTIFIAWFWSLPLSFYWSNEWNIGSKTKIAIPTNINFDSTKCDESNNSCFNWKYSVYATWDNNMTLNDFQTYQAYISWPLFFMWSNILWLNDSSTILENAYNMNSNQIKHSWESIKAIVKIIIMLLFTIPILILIVVNIVRVFWIWIYIWFSPLIFLDQIFWWKVASKQKAFWFKNMIWLIFQPALVVLAFSVSFIFITALYDTLIESWETGYTNSVKEVFLLDQAWKWIVSMDFWDFQDSNNKTEFIWWFFSYLIISILVIILLWTMIRLSFKANEVTSSISESAFNFTQDITKTVKFIPTPYGAQSIWSMEKLWWNVQSLPTHIYGKQAQELADTFWTKPDITNYQDIVTKLKSDNSNYIFEWYKQAIEELKLYENDTGIVNNRSWAKSIIEAIEGQINNNSWLNSIKNDLAGASSASEKLDIIFRNQDTIKDRFN